MLLSLPGMYPSLPSFVDRSGDPGKKTRVISPSPGRRTGAVVSVADYGTRSPWIETWPGGRSLWP